MALVRISNDLVHAVAAKVDNTKSKVYHAAVAPTNPMLVPGNEDILFNLAEAKVWERYATLKTITPVEWQHEVPRVDVKVLDERIDEVQIHRKLLCPPDTKTYGYLDVKLRKDEVPAELVEAMAAFYQRIKDNNDKFIQVRNQVVSFLRSCKSLNDALKKYPDLSLYVPQEYLDRVNHKVLREPAKKTDEAEVHNIDKDLVTSLGVLGALHEQK